MTFERTRDADLVEDLIRRAWDRPEMLPENASIERIPPLPNSAQCFVGRTDGRAIALFVGYQQSSVCIDLHCCLTPECRGRDAIDAVCALVAWLPRETRYRKALGSIPAYNRPMLYVARAAGFTILAVNEKSTMRNGRLEDQIIVERRLS